MWPPASGAEATKQMPNSSLKFDPAAFCARPLVRRFYMALASALAVFLTTLAILREPFRGYLAEVHVSGPAAKGLDLEDAARWLKRTEPSAVVLTGPLRGPIPRSQIRMTYLAPRPWPARLRLDDLATRWLYQYLPEHLQGYRRQVLAESRSLVTAARDREDAARTRVEELRQKQLARYFRQPTFPSAPAEPRTPVAAAPLLSPPAVAPLAESSALMTQLHALRMELARLLASFTDEHPQVITLRKQIAGLEQQLGLPAATSPASGPELIPFPAAAQPTSAAPAGHFTANHVHELSAAAEGEAADLSATIPAALLELTHAARARQSAELRQTERMQELSSEPTSADWSAQPAVIVTRLGGTPRSVTLLLGGILAAIAGAVMFRTSAVAVLPPKLESAGELAAALEIPVIGNTSRLRTAAARIRRRLLTPATVHLAAHLAEGVIALAIAACLISIVIEPTLAGQVAADPFGTLSEVIGRFVS